MGRIGTLIFHLESSVITIPLTTCICVVASTIDGSDVIFTPHAIQHLSIFATIIKVIAAVIIHEPAVGNLKLFKKLSILWVAIRRHSLAV
jgi:hypothetical protein